MIRLSVLILAFVSTLSPLSGSKSLKSKGKLDRSNFIKKTAADSSNSDTTSSDDYDDWDQAKEPKFNYNKTQKDYRKNILSREKNLKLCAEWNMEAAIGSIEDTPWQSDPNDDGENYYPLEIEEREDQVNPKENVVARIMAQYRRDLGFNPVGNFSDSEPEYQEIQKFISCLESRPRKFDHEREARRQTRREKRQMRREALEDPEAKRKAAIDDEMKAEWKLERKMMKRGKRLRKLSEAYSFLKYLGKIPQFTFEALNRMTCEEIRAQSGQLRYFQDLRDFYKTELNYYTLLNWDNLDLTHFAFHNFPIMNQITRNITYLGNSKVISPPVLMSRGINVLRAYEDFIRFHNPRTLEGRRMLLFQRLYRRYYAAVKEKANPSFIDWTQCEVINWPFHIDKSNLNSWTEDDVLLLETLIEDEDLVFEKAETALKSQPAPLGRTENFHQWPVIQVRADEIEGPGCAVSDDELICGNPVRTIEEAQEISKSASVPLAKRKYTKKIRKTTSNAETSSPSSSNLESSPNFYFEIDPFPEVVNAKVICHEPADEEKRAEVLKQALEIFRKTSGQKDAEEIDWNLLSVSSFQNHIIPFSIDFRTLGDVRTLDNLIRMKKLIFNNLLTSKGRSNRIYERLYEKCGNDIGFNLDEFLIKWNAVDVEGWPEGVSVSYSRWKVEEIEAMKALLDANAIVFKLNGKFSELWDESKELLKSPALRRGLLLEQYSTQTVDTFYGNNEESSKTPSFASAVLSPTNRKRPLELIKNARSDSSDFTEEDQSTSIVLDQKPRKKSETETVRVGEFAGYTRTEIDAFAASVDDSIAQYTADRDSSNYCQRKKRILSEIIRGLQLILQHTNCRKLSEIPAVSVYELNEFIIFCCDTLLAVEEDGFLNDWDLRLFVVQSINLRARLSGAQGSIQHAVIKKALLSDKEMLEFLVSTPSSSWNIDFLEGFLDDDSMPIFKTPKSKLRT